MNYFFFRFIRQFLYSLISISMTLFSFHCFAENENTIANLPTTTINNEPISIDANNQKIDLEKNTITFNGNVVIVQDDLTIKADKVIINNMQQKDNQIITAYGNPVYLEKIDIKNPQQPMKGYANKLIYIVKRNSVTLLNNAKLLQAGNQINSNKIIYQIDQQQVFAQSDNKNRVKTKLIPNSEKR